jgi:hypothetical protein
MVRIPREELSEWALPRIQVQVYRIKDEVPEGPVDERTLGVQFDRQLREVAQLRGIHLDVLDQNVQQEIRSALKK